MGKKVKYGPLTKKEHVERARVIQKDEQSYQKMMESRIVPQQFDLKKALEIRDSPFQERQRMLIAREAFSRNFSRDQITEQQAARYQQAFIDSDDYGTKEYKKKEFIRRMFRIAYYPAEYPNLMNLYRRIVRHEK